MADLEFEGRLDRLFAEAPLLDDAGAFARRVQGRLDQSWALRRVLIGGLGVVGGLIAVVQLAASGVIGRAEVLSTQSAKVMTLAMANHVPTHMFMDSLPFSQAFLWAAIALAAVALGLALMRTIGDL